MPAPEIMRKASLILVGNWKLTGKYLCLQRRHVKRSIKLNFFGKEFVEVILTGDTFDDSFNEAIKMSKDKQMAFIHPFDQENIIAGQGTVGMEIMNDIEENIDYLFSSIGGGGLISGVGTYIKSISPRTKIVGCEPAGAPSMKTSLSQGEIIELDYVDKFVDGAAVKKSRKAVIWHLPEPARGYYFST